MAERLELSGGILFLEHVSSTPPSHRLGNSSVDGGGRVRAQLVHFSQVGGDIANVIDNPAEPPSRKQSSSRRTAGPIPEGSSSAPGLVQFEAGQLQRFAKLLGRPPVVPPGRGKEGDGGGVHLEGRVKRAMGTISGKPASRQPPYVTEATVSSAARLSWRRAELLAPVVSMP